jgi:HEPN domain-containing protein
MANRARDWLRQAEDDLLWTKDTLDAGRFAQCCFVAQQTAEKAMKALALHRGNDRVKSHSITEIARVLGENGELERVGKRLDLYYISARYPDAFPSGAPFEYFTRDQAEEALSFAGSIVRTVSVLMTGDAR